MSIFGNLQTLDGRHMKGFCLQLADFFSKEEVIAIIEDKASRWGEACHYKDIEFDIQVLANDKRLLFSYQTPLWRIACENALI